MPIRPFPLSALCPRVLILSIAVSASAEARFVGSAAPPPSISSFSGRTVPRSTATGPILSATGSSVSGQSAPRTAASSPASSPIGAAGLSEAATLDVYARLLGTYVTPAGVRYAAWRSSPANLGAITETVAGLSGPDTKTDLPADRIARMINLYNAKVLEIVLVGDPKGSIKEITPGITGYGVFLEPAVVFDGRKISLRDLETRLRGESKDPRIHFAINCASRSCPPIAREPYRGEKLDAQLDRAARAFLGSRGNLVVRHEAGGSGEGRIRISCSKIFDWYAKDFARAGGAIAFIEKYGPREVADSIRATGGTVTLDYQDYDWSLNAAP